MKFKGKKMILEECQVFVSEFNINLHSVEELTSLLHRSYKKLADMGLLFWAATQSVEKTAERIANGRCLVAFKDDVLIGTICFYPFLLPYNIVCSWYNRNDVGRFGQFAIDPDFQKIGLGRLLIEIVEELAFQSDKRYLALDTSEKAYHLIEYYGKLGFSEIEYIQWNDVNYRSTVMSKLLNNNK